LLLVFIFITVLDAQGELVKVGVLSKRGDTITLARWSPTIEYLNKNIDGYNFQIVPLSFEKLKNSVANSEIDFVLTNTMYYVELEYLYGVSRIATLKNASAYEDGLTSFGGVIFTRSDSSIDSYNDMKDKKFAAVNINSFGGWVMAQKELKDNHIELEDFKSFEFLGSHDNVVHAVKNKIVDIGTVRSDTLEIMQNDGLININDFKIISPKKYKNFPFVVSTELYPEWPFAKMSATSEKLSNAVLVALLNISSDSQVAKISNLSGWTIPLDYTKVHNLLQELQIGPYKKMGELTFKRFYQEHKWFFYYIVIGFIIITIVLLYISKLNMKLKESKKNIEELNSSLEFKVKKRTKELEKMYLEEKLLKNILQTISDINELLVSSFSTDNIIENSLKRLIKQDEYNFVWIGLVNEKNLDVTKLYKDNTNKMQRDKYYLDKKYDDKVFNLAETSIRLKKMILKEIKQDNASSAWLVSIPIRLGLDGEVFGNLAVFSNREVGFLDKEINMLEELATDIGTALNSIYQKTKLKEMELEKISNYEETILAFVNIIEQRDSYTAGHTIRVAQYCRLIAQAMNIDNKDVVKLEKAAILHDIGKVVTPDSILLKPGELSSLEYKLIKEHSNAGYQMLSKIKMYQDLAEIIKYHHSNYDGKGYPNVPKDKLDSIPILSHIMMIADAFDAMTSSRIYKTKKNIDEALEELKLCSGTQFHPDIVTISLEVLANVKLSDSSQMPKSELENRRFAYFFLDSLTDLYNEDYLKIELAKKENENNHLVMVEIHNFSSYNKKYGWNNGNILLKDFAIFFKKRFNEATIFRYRGDDFILMFKDYQQITKEDFADFDLLKKVDLDFSIKHLNPNDIPDLYS